MFSPSDGSFVSFVLLPFLLVAVINQTENPEMLVAGETGMIGYALAAGFPSG
jgi:hypothetical protein